jgi:hypothetical protein
MAWSVFCIDSADLATPVEFDYPQLLDFGSPHLLAYRPETSIAEKFNAIVELESANSRMKDYYDLWVLVKQLKFTGSVVREAIASTFRRRGTPVPSDLPLGLTERFTQNAMKQAQWNAFMRKLGHESDLPLSKATDVFACFVMPVCSSIVQDIPFDGVWPPGGPWQENQ